MGISHLMAFPLVLLAAACGHQDPAFTESRTEQARDSADSTARIRDLGAASETSGGSADGTTPAGIGTEAIDEDAVTAAQAALDAAGDTAGDSEGDDVAWQDGGGDNPPYDDAKKDPADDHSPHGDTEHGKDDPPVDPGKEKTGTFTRRTVDLVQKGPGKVDLLWIVDTSGSMAEEQQYLATNFSALIKQLEKADADFQTAVTTTDVCQDKVPKDLAQRVCPVDAGGSGRTHLRGAFVGDAGRKVLRRGDSDLVSRFTKYTKQGVDGSGFEHGLEAARLAIAKSLSGENEALVRSDAFLAVIVVSDEEDDGIGLGMMDVYTGHNFVADGVTKFKYTDDDMIAYLKSVKGEGHFSVSAITPTRDAKGKLCSAPHTQPLEEGTQYISAAKKSGGIVQSLCATNWDESLARIGLDLSAQITQVSLPTPADAATIEVWVDGVESHDWTYNEGNNAVKFSAGKVPAEGAKIKVSYVEAN